MVLYNVPNVNVPRRAFSSITPFTYPDGITHLEVIERLRAYIQCELVPFINDELGDFTEGVTAEINRLITFVNGKIAEFDSAIEQAENAAEGAAEAAADAAAAKAAAEAALAEARAVLAQVNTAVIDRTQPVSSSDYSFEQFPTRTSETVSINTRTYSVSSVATFPNGDYVAVWYDEHRHPRVGKHYASSGAWEVSNVFNVYGNPLSAPAIQDGHNSLVVAIDGDGYVHVMGNMHANPMRYVRSAVPFSVTDGWITMDASIWPATVSYPWIRRHNSGDLIAFYREGASYASGWWLRRYSVTEQTWGAPIHVMEGRYTSPAMGGYPNSLVLDGDTLHLFYMWRGDSTEASNRDFAYLRSDDLGTSWFRIDGTQQTMPVTPATAPPKFITGATGFMNQGGAAAVNGVPHAVTRETTGGTANIRWIRREGGAWANTVIDTGVASTIGRPALAAYGNVLVALYRKGGQPLIQQLLPTRGPATPLYQLPAGNAEAGWEAAFDAGYLDSHGVLRMTISSTSSGTSNTTNVEPSNGGWGGILDVRLSQPVIDNIVTKRSAPAVPAPAPVDPSPATSERVVPAWNVPGMTSTIRPWYVIGGSARVTTDVPRQPTGRFYGSRCMFPKQARIEQVAVRVVAGEAGALTQFVIAELGATGQPVNVRRSAGVPSGTDGEVLTISTPGISVHPGRVYVVGVQVHGGTNGVAFVGSAEHDPYISWAVPEGHLSASNNKFPGYREVANQGSAPDSPTIGSLEPATITPIVAMRFGVAD